MAGAVDGFGGASHPGPRLRLPAGLAEAIVRHFLEPYPRLAAALFIAAYSFRLFTRGLDRAQSDLAGLILRFYEPVTASTILGAAAFSALLFILSMGFAVSVRRALVGFGFFMAVVGLSIAALLSMPRGVGGLFRDWSLPVQLPRTGNVLVDLALASLIPVPNALSILFNGLVGTAAPAPPRAATGLDPCGSRREGPGEGAPEVAPASSLRDGAVPGAAGEGKRRCG